MSHQIQTFVNDCLFHYGNSLSQLPDFVQHAFASLIMSQEDAYACEAAGPDNPHWETKMLPALLGYLSNSTDEDVASDFRDTWRDCITAYVSQKMQELLEEGNFDA